MIFLYITIGLMVFMFATLFAVALCKAAGKNRDDEDIYRHNRK